jgi:hypothetical protein
MGADEIFLGYAGHQPPPLPVGSLPLAGLLG